MKEQDKYLILIHKRLTNQLSSDEAQELKIWLASDSKHRLLYENTKKSWEQSLQYKSDYEPDTTSEWSKLNEKIDTGKVVHMPARRRWIAAAAAVLLLVAGGFWWLNNMANTPENWVEIQTNDATQEITLPDGSSISLNKNTTLTYRENFADHAERIVKMNGEAFFDVTKNTKPFIIQTNHADVRVLGTSFNVKSDTDDTQVTVQSGKVQVIDKAKTQKAILQKGQKAVADKSGKVRKITPKSLNDLAWKTRKLDFNATPLKEVVNDLETYFTVKIDITQLKSNCLYSGDIIEGDKIEDVLNNLKLSHQVKVEKTTKGYALSGGNC